MMANGDTSTPQRTWFFEGRYWLRDLILSLLLAFIVIVFFYQPVQVEGTSMMPEITNHERIFINKFVYRFEPSKSCIKRVVGLPGEQVSIRAGRVYIDGK